MKISTRYPMMIWPKRTMVCAVTAMLPCLFSACVSKKSNNVATYACNGKSLTFKMVKEKNMGFDYGYHEIWYNKKMLLKIDNEAMGFGLPYKPEVYGDKPCIIFYTPATQAAPIVPTRSTMLYVNAENLTDKDFPAFVQCFKDNLPALYTAMGMDSATLSTFQITGLVMGSEKDFVQYYKSTENSNEVIEIHPDGMIHFVNKEGASNTISSHGLARKVITGNRIAITDSTEINIDKLRHFHNQKSDRSLELDFSFYYDSTSNNQ